MTPRAEREGARRSTRCSTARASPARTASSSTPGDADDASTSTARLFLRERDRRSSASRRSPACSSTARTRRAAFDDFRPEVHDSDGLLLALGERRVALAPARQPDAAAASSGFACRDPHGFGLVQRDRDFDHYQDLETRAERRPSAWIAPRRRLGRGPRRAGRDPDQRRASTTTSSPTGCPTRPPKPGEPLAFAYTLSLVRRRRDAPAGRPRRAPRAATAARSRARSASSIDFAGKELAAHPRRDTCCAASSRSVGDEDAASSLDQHVVKNPVTEGWRLSVPGAAEAARADRAARLPRPGWRGRSPRRGRTVLP